LALLLNFALENAIIKVKGTLLLQGFEGFMLEQRLSSVKKASTVKSQQAHVGYGEELLRRS
jgi:hypothetical protein